MTGVGAEAAQIGAYDIEVFSDSHGNWSGRSLRVRSAQLRSVSTALVLSAAILLCLIGSWIALHAFGVTAATYAFQISAIAQAPTQGASWRAARLPKADIERWIDAVGAQSSVSTSQIPALSVRGSLTRNWLTIVHFTVTSRKLAGLDRLNELIERRSPWRVLNIDRSGEFIPVAVRPGVTALRLSEAVGTEDDRVHRHVQISGPSVKVSGVDVVPMFLFGFLVFSFGPLRGRASDVFAFPRGMHPSMIFCQLLTLALFACFLITYASAQRSHPSLGVFVVDVLVSVNAARWFWASGPSWRGAGVLMRSRPVVIAFGALLSLAGALLASGVV